MSNIAKIVLASIACISLIACHGISSQAKRDLTTKEKAVKVAKGDQETSLKLFNVCKEKSKLETFYHIDDARIRAVEVGANTVQIIYATTYNRSSSYDVRFWRCK